MKKRFGLILGFLAASSATLPAQQLNTPIRYASPAAPRVTIADVQDRHETRMRNLWIASMAAMVAGTAADAASSWHKQESNGVLASSNGSFGMRGVAIKAGITGAVLAPQLIFRKRTDWRNAFTIGNFIEAGVFTGAAVHNLNVPQR